MRKIIPNNKKKILLLLVLLLSCISYAGSPDKKKISYGLTFQSHTVNQDQRTSLDLNPDGELDMAETASLQAIIDQVETYKALKEAFTAQKAVDDE